MVVTESAVQVMLNVATGLCVEGVTSAGACLVAVEFCTGRDHLWAPTGEERLPTVRIQCGGSACHRPVNLLGL